jgi:hypothetical protein
MKKESDDTKPTPSISKVSTYCSSLIQFNSIQFNSSNAPLLCFLADEIRAQKTHSEEAYAPQNVLISTLYHTL